MYKLTILAFVLATTSIGQEGLDFHLYCKNIYYWNLPSNPVDFEQREGRLNRYNSLAIRESILSLNIPFNDGLNGKTYWQKIFDRASGFCHYNDRYNLGLSPNWICTPEKKNTQTQLIRHILDLPNSCDKRRYESLIERLRLYRLALGQPNPDNYLRKLEEENVLKGIDARSLYLNLFPFENGHDSRRLKAILKNDHQILVLVKDAELKAMELFEDSNGKTIQDLVNKSAQIIRSNINPANNLSRSSRPLKNLIAALLNFVKINDKVNDRLPIIGYKDDLLLLKQGLQYYMANV